MSQVVRTLVLLSACLLFVASLAQAEDGLVAPGAARDIKAVSPDADQKMAPELTEGAAKIVPPTDEVAPPAKKALEAQAPKVEEPIQQPEMKQPR